MGKADVKAKTYMSRPEVFADVFNYFLYQGQDVLKPEMLTELDPSESVLLKDTNDRTKVHQKYRDILKKAVMMEDEDSAYLLLLGEENQMNIHYAMPVKNMVYDALNYSNQVAETGRGHREKRDVKKSGEYLSGFTKKDHLIPVFTLVVYFGQEPWDGPRSIHEMFLKRSEVIKKYVPDYRINLIAPLEMDEDEIRKFRSDFRELATMIRCGRDKKKWAEQIEGNERFRHIDPLTADLACTVTKAEIELNVKEGEEIDMCQALKEIREEEYNRGIEEGLRQAENKSRRRGQEMCRAMREIREEEYNRGMQEGIAEGRLLGEAEGRLLGEAEGRLLGEEEGRRLEKIYLLAGLVKDHLLDLKEAAKRAEMPEQDFLAAMEQK